MPSLIEKIIDGIIKAEGGYVDHPNDRGGPTNYGITTAAARAAGFVGDMRGLPLATARAIYLGTYYTRPGFDQVAQLSETLAAELTDTGVNMGPPAAITFLQRALNVFNQQGKLYPDLKADGNFGPKTLSALSAFLKSRPKDGERVLFTTLNCLQGARYVEIAERDPTQESFAFGWLAQRVTL